MHLPTSTYRIQVNSSFKLSDLNKIVNYLAQLGISTVYSAPLSQSRAGSVHGYDVTNPHVINPEIGSEEEFKALIRKLQEKQIGWLQDIVPNHMAFDSSNPWLMDIFEKGPHSDYYHFFDIDWNYQDDVYILEEEKGLKGKVMAPFLGGEQDELVEKGEIKIAYDKRGFFVKYYALEFPLSWPSYVEILSYGKKFYEVKKDEDWEQFSVYRQLLTDLNKLRDDFNHSFDPENGRTFRSLMFHYYSEGGELKAIIDHCLNTINTNPKSLLSILNQQYFKLSHWRTSEKKINYRRFFTINDLICLRIEDPNVFEHYHRFIKENVDQKYFSGLRVDHIDGLKLPLEYVERLRDLVGEQVYIIVEKILESEEQLPAEWPMEGTSGYEFLSVVNRLLTEDKNKGRFTDIYHDFINKNYNYDDLVFEKKMFILKEKMAGELNNLVRQILETTHEPHPSDLKEALAVFLASFPVYRMYPSSGASSEADLKVLEEAINVAQTRAPELKSTLTSIYDLFSKENGNEKVRNFIIRSQQFTGPLAAKGVEDTVFYIYNRLISHNEVGDSPKLFGSSVEDFHKRMQERLQHTPYSINATATHDTKRGEDARMRINAISEMPDEWTSAIYTFREINKKHKQEAAGVWMPDDNDEYFIYQALIGSFPMEGKTDEEFSTRLKEYLIKVVREAKVHSDWSEQNEPYEKAISSFIDNILADQEFLNAFVPLFEKIKQYGIVYSLGQTLLKVTSPGIPDIYQGCELWDLSFVDPDNRRFVDFEMRQRYLEEILQSGTEPAYLQNLVKGKEDGRIKLFTLFNALQVRNSFKDLFEKGEYLPLTVGEKGAEHLIAFARKLENEWTVIVVPKSIVAISSEEEFALGESVWEDTVVVLPGDAPKKWKNVFSNKVLELQQVERSMGVAEMVNNDAFLEPFVGENRVTENQLVVADILREFPVAILIPHFS